MVYEKKIITMSDGNKNVFHGWIPGKDEDVELVMILSHGMAEYAARYDRFASSLCSRKIALFVEDHRGHGETADLAEKDGTGKFGYISDRNGFLRVVEDIHEEILLLRSRFPGKRIVLFGHSFGSFVSQCIIEKYGDLLDGCILCGTAGPRPMGAAKVFSSVLCALGEKKRKSKFLDFLSFANYSAKIKEKRTSYDWLSRDPEQVDLYNAHPWCGFVCTGEFFHELASGLCLIHKKTMMASIPKELPVFFIAGTGDPVGGYCKTISALIGIYKKNGMEDVEYKFYSDARHELLNEINREEVEADVIGWIEKHFLP